jgi:hypothetical protein
MPIVKDYAILQAFVRQATSYRLPVNANSERLPTTFRSIPRPSSRRCSRSSQRNCCLKNAHDNSVAWLLAFSLMAGSFAVTQVFSSGCQGRLLERSSVAATAGLFATCLTIWGERHLPVGTNFPELLAYTFVLAVGAIIGSAMVAETTTA